MVWGRLRTALTWGAGVFALAQVATVAALVVTDQRRKRESNQRPFPSTLPTEVTAGNDLVTVYTKGRDLYDAMLEAIENAQSTVLLETYIWKSDRVGQKFKAALTSAAERGVDVYVVYDVFANLVVKRSFFDFDPRIRVLRHRPSGRRRRRGSGRWR